MSSNSEILTREEEKNLVCKFKRQKVKKKWLKEIMTKGPSEALLEVR